jgi:hypothetical protein
MVRFLFNNTSKPILTFQKVKDDYTLKRIFKDLSKKFFR